MDQDFTSQLRYPALWKRLPYFLSHDEVDRFLDAPDPDTPLGLRDRALLELYYATGARVSELLALTMRGVLADPNTVRITGKGGKERMVPFHEMARAKLDRYLKDVRPELAARASGFEPNALFLTHRGRPLSRNWVFKLVRRYARLAGIEYPVSPHVLRPFLRHTPARGRR